MIARQRVGFHDCGAQGAGVGCTIDRVADTVPGIIIRNILIVVDNEVGGLAMACYQQGSNKGDLARA